MTRRYGALRDTHDYRDLLLPKAMKVSALPQAVNLMPWGGLIKDQGAEGSCTGHAGSSSVEWQFRKYKKESPNLSPQFLYVNELLNEGSFPNDNGAQPRTICQVLNSVGVCEEGIDPYVAGQITKPTEAAIEGASKFRLGGYHRLNGLLDVLSCLGNSEPWPILIGFSVYESFESDEVGNTGIMPTPDVKKELHLGGHEVLGLGYDSAKRAVLCQNSWGSGWGQNGYFWMPYDVINDPSLCADLWVIHLGHWSKATP